MNSIIKICVLYILDLTTCVYPKYIYIFFFLINSNEVGFTCSHQNVRKMKRVKYSLVTTLERNTHTHKSSQAKKSSIFRCILFRLILFSLKQETKYFCLWYLNTILHSITPFYILMVNGKKVWMRKGWVCWNVCTTLYHIVHFTAVNRHFIYDIFNETLLLEEHL